MLFSYLRKKTLNIKPTQNMFWKPILKYRNMMLLRHKHCYAIKELITNHMILCKTIIKLHNFNSIYICYDQCMSFKNDDCLLTQREFVRKYLCLLIGIDWLLY